jgi:hypothetical protein
MLDRLRHPAKVEQAMEKRRKWRDVAALGIHPSSRVRKRYGNSNRYMFRGASDDNSRRRPVARRYQVRLTQITEWKKVLLGNASSVFESARSKHDEAFKQKLKEDRLYKQIGWLQVEVIF